MQQIAVWHVGDKSLKKLIGSQIDLEKELEEWIERDPSLLEDGLMIIGRQVRLESGRLDLLGLDVQGNIVIIEIKRGMIVRDTITQAIDYASSIRRMANDVLRSKISEYLGDEKTKTIFNKFFEKQPQQIVSQKQKRIVKIYVVGTGKQPELERIADYLSEYSIPISVVSIDVFEIERGQRILVRELTETEKERPSSSKSTPILEQSFAQADQNGIGKEFRMLYDAATKHGLYPRLWQSSIMYAPPFKRKRCLFNIRTKPKKDGRIEIWNGPSVFADFYPIKAQTATELLGKQGWRALDTGDVEKYIAGLSKLFEQIEATKD